MAKEKSEYEKKLSKFYNIVVIIALVGIVLSIFCKVSFAYNQSVESVSLWGFILGTDLFDKKYHADFSWSIMLVEVFLLAGIIVSGFIGTSPKFSKKINILGLVLGGILTIASAVGFFFYRELFMISQTNALTDAINNGTVKASTGVFNFVAGAFLALSGIGYIVGAYIPYTFIKNEKDTNEK